MKRIGIDRASQDAYENIMNAWRAVWPIPIISYAKLDPQYPVPGFNSSEIFDLIFREDDFDAVTRVRRGRFYQPAQQQRPSEEWTFPHPAHGNIGGTPRIDGLVKRSLCVYDRYQIATGPQPKIVALGSPDSLWRVLGCEHIITEEYLFTLKARGTFGIVPEIDADTIPSRGRERVVETLQKLTDAAHRESPSSIIDRARDAAQCCLGTWIASELNNKKLLAEDLGSLIKQIKRAADTKIANRVLLHAAEIVRVLHARGKPNEQERYDIRPPMEDDAELALRAVGFIIREVWMDDGLI